MTQINKIKPVSPKLINNHLAQAYGLYPDQINHMLVKLRQSFAKQLEEAEQGLSGGDMERVSAAAHTLKGILLNFGLDDLVNIVSELEIQAKSGKPNVDMNEMVKVLRNALQPLL